MPVHGLKNLTISSIENFLTSTRHRQNKYARIVLTGSSGQHVAKINAVLTRD